MNTLTNLTDPLELALLAAKPWQDEPVWFGDEIPLQMIAIEYARKRDFIRALAVCKEIYHGFMLIRPLMEIGCEMLKNGNEEWALKTIDFAWEKSRESLDDFHEQHMLVHLNTLQSFGHGKLVRSVLKLAMARAEHIDDGDSRLKLYRTMLPHLAVHLQEMAEDVIDHILSLPSGIPGTRDENLIPEKEILTEVAIAISRHGLIWTEERQEKYKYCIYNTNSKCSKSVDNVDIKK